MMKDDRLDELMLEAKDSYRVPPAADFDAMWARIEHEHFDAPKAIVPRGDAPLVLDGAPRRDSRRLRWLAPSVGIAATLLVGVGLGRLTAPAASVVTVPMVTEMPASVPPAANVAEPLQRVTYEYVARTVALLDSLPTSGAATLDGDARFRASAAQLLGTTRLLLDSPAATDPRLRDLLEDLELVLAQVASLRTAPRADELTFIAEAMTERDVVPRLRTVAASYTASGY
jgi:hypothetical protein